MSAQEISQWKCWLLIFHPWISFFERLHEILIAKYKLDVLVNNAGGLLNKHHTTIDGNELTFAINHLAPFLLTHELLDSLEAGAPSRVVNVSSGAHNMGKIDFDNLQSDRFVFFLITLG